MLHIVHAFAGTVRTIKTDDKKMNRIYLKMGQSTVLRFQDDKPRKVVIGNLNYYNVEFVKGTKDVTLQPLGTVKTNLFVYCQKNTYGFLISTSNYGKYDDLVNVKWQPPLQRIRVKAKIIVINNKRSEKINKMLILNNQLKVSSFIVQSYKDKKSVFIDFKITNTTKKEIRMNDFNVFATRSNKKLEYQKLVLEKIKIAPEEKIKARLIIALEQRKGFTINFSLKNEKSKFIVSKRLLL
ncbi:MAG: DUF5067 domain-containing protein [Bacteriovoracaceae bacterium]|jgi:hypothetical protein|nr:DUF5067 domain-containing protein [Bacteriovoracaceae bacterium]